MKNSYCIQISIRDQRTEKLHVKLSSVAIEIKSCFVNEKIVNFGVFVVVTMSKVCVVYGELGVRFI